MKENKTKKSNKKKTANKNVTKKTVKVENKKETVKTEKKQDNKKEVVKVEKIEKKEKNNEIMPVTNNEMVKLVKIVLLITAIFLIFYGITILVTDNRKEEQTPTDVTIQYDEILLSSLFEQPNSEYYVLVTKEDDDYAGVYSVYTSKYQSKENKLRLYTANLSNGFNSSYEAEESNINITKIEELKLKDSTLLKISNKKIVAAYEGSTKIIEHLKSISK